MARKRKGNDADRKIHIVVITGSLAIMFLLGIFLGIYNGLGYNTENPVTVHSTPEQRAPRVNARTVPQTVSEFVKIPEGSSFATIAVPAVDDKGNGVVTNLDVYISPGNGKVLTDIDKLLFWVDTQTSIRTATKVAQEITRMDISKYDIVYSVRANATIIEGGSAGAALTIATIAALENKTLNRSVMITGTISDDWKIGPIGEVVAKASAAKDIGASLFLVPVGQGSSIIYRPEKKCYQEGSLQVCETKTTSEKVYISKDVGIDVMEVADIQAALKYFLVG